MNFDNIVKNLEELIETNIHNLTIPYAKGNSIRIKQYIIRKNKNGYVVYNCKENRKLSEVSFKLSALALAKNFAENNTCTKEIERLDRLFLKHYNDILFFKNIIKNSSDTKIKETRRMRLEVSIQKAYHIKQQLEDFIF